MKLKSLALVAALSVASVAVQAKTKDLGVLGGSIVANGGYASEDSFVNDKFTFSLTTASTVESNVTTFDGSFNPAAYGIYTSGLDGTVGTKDDVAGSGPDLAALFPHARALDIPGRDHNLAVGDRVHKEGVLAFLAEGR